LLLRVVIFRRRGVGNERRICRGSTIQPIRELSSWYTDRSLIDIIGSTSLVPDSHGLEPDGVLCFGMERAYVETLLTQSSPGYELGPVLNFSLAGSAEQ
jgi:hypothetical protein